MKPDLSCSSDSSSDTVYQSLPPRSPKKDKLSDSSSSLEANYEVTLTVKIKELQNMRQRCNQLEETECELKNKVEKLKLELKSKDEELTKTKIERDSLDKEMQTYCNKAEVNTRDLQPFLNLGVPEMQGKKK